jgi:hypothetical protein
MSWRFRKSFRVLPGVRLNVSRRGISTTIGGGPLSVHVGPTGTFANFNLPGTGISHRERIGGTTDESHHTIVGDEPLPRIPRATPAPRDGERTVIESASTYELASEGLAHFQRLIVDVHSEQQALDAEIAALGPEEAKKRLRFERWSNGFVLKRLFKATFQRLSDEANQASAHLAELHEQRRLTNIATIIDVSEDQLRPFGRLCDAFSRLSEAQRIWDTLSIQRTNQFRERTIAVNSIERTIVRFQLGGSPLLKCKWRVPHLANANGGDLFVYPGFLLYQVSRQSFAVIDAREVQLSLSLSRFIEEEGVPSDAEVVGQTWKKANKDGSPDRRFANNYQIPIVKYAELAFTTGGGLNERYMVSNYASADQLAKTWSAYAGTFDKLS